MKKVSDKKIAEALYAVYKEVESEKDRKEVVDNFYRVLRKYGKRSRLSIIMRLVEEVAIKDQGGRHIVVEMAQRTPEAKKIKKLFTRKDFVEEMIRPELMAGVRVVIDKEKMLDVTMKRKLEKILE